MMTNRIPEGWFDLVSALRAALDRDFPGVSVAELSADRGWLHVRVDHGSLDPADQLCLNRRIQGFVTASLSTCMCCGSGSGRDRGDARRVTCDECENEKEACDA